MLRNELIQSYLRYGAMSALARRLVNINVTNNQAAQRHVEAANGEEPPCSNLWGYDESTRST